MENACAKKVRPTEMDVRTRPEGCDRFSGFPSARLSIASRAASLERPVHPPWAPTTSPGDSPGIRNQRIRCGARKMGKSYSAAPLNWAARSPENCLLRYPPKPPRPPSSNSVCGGGAAENTAPARTCDANVTGPTYWRADKVATLLTHYSWPLAISRCSVPPKPGSRNSPETLG